MHTNPLFEILSSPETLLASVPISLNKTEAGRSYFRLSLIPREFTLAVTADLNLRLSEHHISIDKVIGHPTPELSKYYTPYHYTANFKDIATGQQYCLHVYFDKNGRLTIQPELHKLTDSTRHKIELTKELAYLLRDFSIVVSSPIMSQLRSILLDKVTQLDDAYVKSETEASGLSMDLSSHDSKVLYIAKLHETLKLLEPLIPLVDSNKYKSRAFIISSILKLIETDSRVAASAEPEDMMAAVSSDVPVPVIRKIIDVPAGSAIHRANLKAEEINNLYLQFLALIKDDPATYFKALGLIVLRINDLSLELEMGSFNLSLLELERLRQLQLNTNNDIQECFLRLSKSKRFDILRESPHVCALLISEAHLNYALVEKDVELLSFILDVSSLNINTQRVTIRESIYPSPVHYCVANPDSSPEMLRLFCKLLQHGSSLMLVDAEGLPLIYSLFVNDHPLRGALNEGGVFENTLGSKSFLAQAKRLLKACQLVNPEKAASIDNVLRVLQSQYTSIGIHGMSDRGAVKMALGAGEIRRDFDFVDVIFKDPRILELNARLHATEIKLQAKQHLTRAERLAQEAAALKLQDDHQARIRATYTTDLPPDALEGVILVNCDHIELCIGIMECMCEIADIDNELRCKPQKDRKARLEADKARLDENKSVLARRLIRLHNPPAPASSGSGFFDTRSNAGSGLPLPDQHYGAGDFLQRK